MENKESQQITDGRHERVNESFINSQDLEQKDLANGTTLPAPTQLTEVLLCSANNKLVDDVSVDREVRDLCLSDRRVTVDGNSTSDEDSDCVLVPGDATEKSELILIESTSSSPILTGTGIPTQLLPPDGEGDVTSAFNVVGKCGGEGVPSDCANRQQRESTAKSSLVAIPTDEDVVHVEQQPHRLSAEEMVDEDAVDDEGREKSGLSRCAVRNLADGAGASVDAECDVPSNGKTTTHNMDEEDEECTCGSGGGGEKEEEPHKRDVPNRVNEGYRGEGPAVAQRGMPEDTTSDDTPPDGLGGASETSRSDNAIIQLNGVQSEAAITKQTRENNRIVSEDHEFCASAEVLSGSGSSSSNSNPAARKTSMVSHKNQTPTSVRTTATQVGGGNAGFGKSELQLETPKILSKRLQQLFQSAKCDLNDDVDGVVVASEEEEVVVADDEKQVEFGEKKTNTAAVAASGKASGSAAPESGLGLADNHHMEETPSSSMTSSLHLIGENSDCQMADDEPGGSSKAGDQPLAGGGKVVSQVADEEVEEAAPPLEGNGDAIERAGLAINGVVALDGNQDFESEAWPDCEEVGDESEEICTCRNYSDEEVFGYDEDEQLPSKDVDLSGFTSHDLLQEESGTGGPSGAAPSVNAAAVTTPSLAGGRKRKMSEASNAGPAESPCSSGSTNGQVYIVDVMQSKRSRSKYAGSSLGSPKTPTTCSGLGAIPAFLRTPRSAQSMHLLPKEHLSMEMSGWLVQFQKWAEQDRVLALNHIIDLCEPAQVRHVMKVIEPQFQRDFISLLPRELALQVLSYLEPKDLLRAAQTCRNWRFLCDDNLLWKDKCKQGNIMIDAESDRPKRGRAGNMPPIASPWKAAFMRQHIIELNWRSRPIREPKVLKGHDDHVITCLQFCGNRIVSGSDDNTLKVWSAVTGKCLRVLVGHTGGVWSSQMSSKYIISGSTDRTLKVWNAETGHCEHTLYGHTSTVRCMHLHGDQVVSGSRDATLRVWDVNRGRCLHILVGHLAAVRCVQYDGKLVVSGAYDYTVKVWNPERQECLHTLQGHTNRVYSLQFDGIHVVSGSLDTSIRVWDAETGSCKHTLMGHQSLTSGMELRDNILVSGNADSTVKIWDIVSGQCLQTLSGPNKHQSAVTCLQFNSRFVITSSDDGTVKLWDVKTGEFIRNLVALESGGSGGVVWRIRASDTKLICAVGSRNGTEETKLMVLDFDVEGACLKCS